MLRLVGIVARVVAVGGLVSIPAASGGCTGASDALPEYWPAPDFALVNQLGDTVRTSDLRGRIWVASFIFTNCTGVCPLISTRMAALRDRLREKGLLGEAVRLVSITVDPERDTPGVLREYAARYGGSPPAEWAFLTGQPPDAMRRMIQEGFHLTAVGPTEARGTPGTAHANYQVQHSPRVLLIDPDGVVRGTYNATEANAIDRIMADIAALAVD